MLPFTTEQFLEVFEEYNQTVWPMQSVLVPLALAAILLSIRRDTMSNRFVSGILAFLWGWMAVAYHFLHFTAINPAAWAFGAVFLMQAALFLYAGVIRHRLVFQPELSWATVAGGLLLIYALLVYPVLGHVLGHRYPHSPTFGVPCPTTIFTFGMLLWTARPVPWPLLIIPGLWSLVGSSAAVLLSIREDFGLLAAGIVGVSGVLLKHRQPSGLHTS